MVRHTGVHSTQSDYAPVVMYPMQAIEDVAAASLDEGMRRGARRGVVLGASLAALGWALYYAIAWVCS